MWAAGRFCGLALRTSIQACPYGNYESTGHGGTVHHRSTGVGQVPGSIPHVASKEDLVSIKTEIGNGARQTRKSGSKSGPTTVLSFQVATGGTRKVKSCARANGGLDSRGDVLRGIGGMRDWLASQAPRQTPCENVPKEIGR